MRLTGTRVLAGLAVVAIMATPAAAFFGPVLVQDPVAIGKAIQEIKNQVASLQNEARNLTKLPSVNLGSITGEVQSVSAQANGIPAQIRGIVSANQILQNAPIDAQRTQQINAQAQQADGAQQQAQVQSSYLGQINSTLQQKNAADAAQKQADAANTADAAQSLLTLTGN